MQTSHERGRERRKSFSGPLNSRLSRLSLGSDASSGSMEREGLQEKKSLKQRISLQPPHQQETQQQNPAAGTSQESSTLPEDRLKLAPILARRLEVVASASSFSSRTTSSSTKSGSPSPRSDKPQLLKLPSLLRNLEGRSGERPSPLIGSTVLPQVASPDFEGACSSARHAPACGHSFELAKGQVDHDLKVFLQRDTKKLLDKLSREHRVVEDEDVRREQEELVRRVHDIADECYTCSVDDFKLAVTEIVDILEEDRSLIKHRGIKALYTKLLFILTRCSRLLITEENLNLFAAEPRERKQGTNISRGPLHASMKAPHKHPPKEAMSDSILRCHTMPVRAMADIAQQLRIGEEREESEGGGLQQVQEGSERDSAGPQHRMFGPSGDGEGCRSGEGGQEGLESERFSRTTHTSGITHRKSRHGPGFESERSTKASFVSSIKSRVAAPSVGESERASTRASSRKYGSEVSFKLGGDGTLHQTPTLSRGTPSEMESHRGDHTWRRSSSAGVRTGSSRPTASSMCPQSQGMSHVDSLGHSGAGGSSSEMGTSHPEQHAPSEGDARSTSSGPISQLAQHSPGSTTGPTPPKKPGVLKQFTSKLVRTLSKVGSGKSSPRGKKEGKESSTGHQAFSRSTSSSSFLSSATHFLRGSGKLDSPRSPRASKGTPKAHASAATSTGSAHEGSPHIGGTSTPQQDLSKPLLPTARGSQTPPPQGILLGVGARGHQRTSPHVHHVAFNDTVVVGDDDRKGTHSFAHPPSRHTHGSLQDTHQQGSPRALGRSKSSQSATPFSPATSLPLPDPRDNREGSSHKPRMLRDRLSWGAEHRARGPSPPQQQLDHAGTGAAEAHQHHPQQELGSSPPSSAARSSHSIRPSNTRPSHGTRVRFFVAPSPPSSSSATSEGPLAPQGSVNLLAKESGGNGASASTRERERDNERTPPPSVPIDAAGNGVRSSLRSGVRGSWDLSKSTSRLAAAAAAATAAVAANPKTPSPLTVAELRARGSNNLGLSMAGMPTRAESAGVRSLKQRQGGRSLQAVRTGEEDDEDSPSHARGKSALKRARSEGRKDSKQDSDGDELPAKAAGIFGQGYPDLQAHPPSPLPPGQSNQSAPAVLTHQHLHKHQLEQQQQHLQSRTAVSAQIPKLDHHQHQHQHHRHHQEHEHEFEQQRSPQQLMLTPPALSTQELPELHLLERQSRESPLLLPSLPENLPFDLGKEQQQQQQQQQQEQQLAPNETTRQLILQQQQQQHQKQHQQEQLQVQEQQQEGQQLREVEQQQEQKLQELLPPGVSPSTDWSQQEAQPTQHDHEHHHHHHQQQQQQGAYDPQQLQPIAHGFPEPMSISEYASERPSPEDMVVVCSVCEEQWPTWRLEEHSELCAVLRQLSSSGLSVDGMLTTLANVIEEQMEMGELHPSLRPEVESLVRLARIGAALQPDGSKVPPMRCHSVHADLSQMADSVACNDLSTITITYAKRMLRLVEDKVTLLYEPFYISHPQHDSGASTPRSAPQGMSIEEFDILKLISRGAFGRVYLARKHSTGDLFAIKVMKKRDLIRKNMVESVTNERNILAMANNPFVVRFYYSFTSKENLYIVMEYLNGGDCYSLLRNLGALDEEVSRLYIAETVLALEYCHAQGIIHRDMKPDNMLVNNSGHIKLTDFGLSCIGVIDTADNMGAPPDQPAKRTDDGTACSEYMPGASIDGDRDSQGMAVDHDSGNTHMSYTSPSIHQAPASQRTSPDWSLIHGSGGAAHNLNNLNPPAPYQRHSMPVGTGGCSSPQQHAPLHPPSENPRTSRCSFSASGTEQAPGGAAGLHPGSFSMLQTPHQSSLQQQALSEQALRAQEQQQQQQQHHQREQSSGGGAEQMSISSANTQTNTAAATHNSAGLPTNNIGSGAPPNTSSNSNISCWGGFAQGTPTLQALGTPRPSTGAPQNMGPGGGRGRMVVPEGEAKRAVGTPDYLAPELLLGTGHGPEVDWWALGAILYEFITGIPPFNADSPEEIFDNILDRRITWPEDPEDMSPECRDLIDKLLTSNPSKRLGHRGAGEIKMHPWFRGVDWTDLARLKAVFVPQIENDTDTSYFEKKHVSAKSMAEDLDVVNRDRAAARERRSRRTAKRNRHPHGEAPPDSAFPPPPPSHEISESQMHLVVDSGYPSMFQTPHQLDSGYPSLCASPPHNDLSGTFPCLTADDTVAAAARAAAALPSRDVSSGGSAFAAAAGVGGAAAPGGGEASYVRGGSWGELPNPSTTHPQVNSYSAPSPRSKVLPMLPSQQELTQDVGGTSFMDVHGMSVGSSAVSPTFGGDGTRTSSRSPPPSVDVGPFMQSTPIPPSFTFRNVTTTCPSHSSAPLPSALPPSRLSATAAATDPLPKAPILIVDADSADDHAQSPRPHNTATSPRSAHHLPSPRGPNSAPSVPRVHSVHSVHTAAAAAAAPVLSPGSSTGARHTDPGESIAHARNSNTVATVAPPAAVKTGRTGRTTSSSGVTMSHIHTPEAAAAMCMELDELSRASCGSNPPLPGTTAHPLPAAPQAAMPINTNLLPLQAAASRAASGPGSPFVHPPPQSSSSTMTQQHVLPPILMSRRGSASMSRTSSLSSTPGRADSLGSAGAGGRGKGGSPASTPPGMATPAAPQSSGTMAPSSTGTTAAAAAAAAASAAHFRSSHSSGSSFGAVAGTGVGSGGGGWGSPNAAAACMLPTCMRPERTSSSGSRSRLMEASHALDAPDMGPESVSMWEEHQQQSMAIDETGVPSSAMHRGSSSSTPQLPQVYDRRLSQQQVMASSGNNSLAARSLPRSASHKVRWSSSSSSASPQLPRCYSHPRAHGTTAAAAEAAAAAALPTAHPPPPHLVAMPSSAPFAPRHTISGSTQHPQAPLMPLPTLQGTHGPPHTAPQHMLGVGTGGGSVRDGTISVTGAAAAAANRWLQRSSSSGKRRATFGGTAAESSSSSNLARGDSAQVHPLQQQASTSTRRQRSSSSEESSSGSTGGTDDLLPPGVDPFGNFSFTNYQTLSQTNVEKLMRLREEFQARSGSTSATGVPALSKSSSMMTSRMDRKASTPSTEPQQQLQVPSSVPNFSTLSAPLYASNPSSAHTSSTAQAVGHSASHAVLPPPGPNTTHTQQPSTYSSSHGWPHTVSSQHTTAATTYTPTTAHTTSSSIPSVPTRLNSSSPPPLPQHQQQKMDADPQPLLTPSVHTQQHPSQQHQQQQQKQQQQQQTSPFSSYGGIGAAGGGSPAAVGHRPSSTSTTSAGPPQFPLDDSPREPQCSPLRSTLSSPSSQTSPSDSLAAAVATDGKLLLLPEQQGALDSSGLPPPPPPLTSIGNALHPRSSFGSRGSSRLGSPGRASPVSNTQGGRTPLGSGTSNWPPVPSNLSTSMGPHEGASSAPPFPLGAPEGDNNSARPSGSFTQFSRQSLHFSSGAAAGSSAAAGSGGQAAGVHHPPCASPSYLNLPAPNSSMLSRGSLPLLTASLLQQQVQHQMQREISRGLHPNSQPSLQQSNPYTTPHPHHHQHHHHHHHSTSTLSTPESQQLHLQQQQQHQQQQHQQPQTLHPNSRFWCTSQDHPPSSAEKSGAGGVGSGSAQMDTPTSSQCSTRVHSPMHVSPPVTSQRSSHEQYTYPPGGAGAAATAELQRGASCPGASTSASGSPAHAATTREDAYARSSAAVSEGGSVPLLRLPSLHPNVTTPFAPAAATTLSPSLQSAQLSSGISRPGSPQQLQQQPPGSGSGWSALHYPGGLPQHGASLRAPKRSNLSGSASPGSPASPAGSMAGGRGSGSGVSDSGGAGTGTGGRSSLTDLSSGRAHTSGSGALSAAQQYQLQQQQQQQQQQQFHSQPLQAQPSLQQQQQQQQQQQRQQPFHLGSGLGAAASYLSARTNAQGGSAGSGMGVSSSSSHSSGSSAYLSPNLQPPRSGAGPPHHPHPLSRLHTHPHLYRRSPLQADSCSTSPVRLSSSEIGSVQGAQGTAVASLGGGGSSNSPTTSSSRHTLTVPAQTQGAAGQLQTEEQQQQQQQQEQQYQLQLR